MGLSLAEIQERMNKGPQQKRYAGANIRFYMELEADPVATQKANGVPKTREVEMLEVHYPGGDKTPVRVEDHHRAEYAELYKAFKDGLEPPTEGTDLRNWALIPRSAVEELRFFGFKTVEQLSEANDEQKRRIGPLQSWCKKAKEWLKAGESKQAEYVQLKEENERMKLRLAKQEDQIAMLIRRVQAVEGTSTRAEEIEDAVRRSN